LFPRERHRAFEELQVRHRARGVVGVVQPEKLRAARNLVNVLVVEPGQADPVSLLRFSNTLITKGAVAKFEEMLA